MSAFQFLIEQLIFYQSCFWTHLCKYELGSEVEGVQFVCLLQLPPLLLDQALDGILQPLAVTQRRHGDTSRPNVHGEAVRTTEALTPLPCACGGSSPA